MAEDRQLRLTRAGMIFSGVAAIGAIVAAIFGGLSLYKPRENMRPFTTHVDSPILASGGSLTFRSQQQWTCSGSIKPNLYTSCTTSIDDVKSVNTWWNPEDVRDQNDTSDDPTPNNNDAKSVASENNSSLTLYLRDKDGNPKKDNGPYVTLSLSESAGSGSSPAKTVVTASVGNGAGAGLVMSHASEPNDPNTAIQYFDPGCHVHGTNDSPTTDPLPACEHPGYVLWPSGTTYRCKHGGCRVELTHQKPT